MSRLLDCPWANLSPDVLQARGFAVCAHGEQTYGKSPYVAHLDAVAGLLFSRPAAAQITAYLHDVVEDTPVGLDLVERAFGPRIAANVALLTDPDLPTRADRKTAANVRFAGAGHPLYDALGVKVADRLCNVRACRAARRDSLLARYLSEHDAFREAVYRPRSYTQIWAELDALVAFERARLSPP